MPLFLSKKTLKIINSPNFSQASFTVFKYNLGMIFLTLPSLFSYSPTWLMQGLQHPVLSPSHVILIFSLAFIIGQQGNLGKHLILLFIAVICGMLMNHFLQASFTLELWLLVLALIIGLLVVIRIKTKPLILLSLSLLLTAFTGFLIGLDSQPISIPGLRTNSIINWHIGAILTITLSATILSLIALFIRRFGDGIILRVLGSWVATIALITLALQYTKL